MNVKTSPEYRPPEYRVRLFLSVDLIGSTAYKAGHERSSFEWIKAFQRFYSVFPKELLQKYKNHCEDAREIHEDDKNSPPKTWKTIGDEILFANRVNSIAHLSVCVNAFHDTLIKFGRGISQNFPLNVKGNAWVAAFPSPNRSIHLAMDATDPISGNRDLISESFEAKIDADPSGYDFLGKGIDSGFRIAKNSTIDTLTISPGLALLLCDAKRYEKETNFLCEFSFHEPQIFKGVVNGEKYPVVSLVMRHDETHDHLKCLEARLLNKNHIADHSILSEYLNAYVDHHKIERPTLKLFSGSNEEEPPEHYQNFLLEWENDNKDNERQEKAYKESAINKASAPNSEEYQPTSDELMEPLRDAHGNDR